MIALRHKIPTHCFQTMAEEIFDIVNERDAVIGQAPRQEVHARGLWHRAVHILVFNARGEVFLQKRSMLKDIAKGKWDSSTSGHVDSGEHYDAAAVRELGEEIGLFVTQTPARLFKIDACKETGWEFCWIYRCASEGPFVLHPQEIETGAWFTTDAVTQWVAEKPRDFASAFVLLWRSFCSRQDKKADA
jgi:isopentenyl-diphosphate Delta-isomerase